MRDSRPCFPLFKCMRALPAAVVFILLASRAALAHQVPSLTVEALFSADRSYALRISLDPRLFISDQPSSLPPVPIAWYREQTPDELAVTMKKAAEYLLKALSVKFGAAMKAVENCEFQPMDGATNMPLSAETKEVHLLAQVKGVVPDGEKDFSITLSRDANVSMILMSSFEGAMERRPNVVFPGETSRPYELVFPVKSAVAAPLEQPVKELHAVAAEPESRTGAMLWIAAFTGMLLSILGVMRWRRRKI